MAASKKSVKTSKTSHVLNVITGGSPADSVPAVEEGEQAALPNRDRRPIPPILELARENDDAISNQILNALEEELKNSEEEKAEESEPVPELIPELEPDIKEKQPETLPGEKREDVLQSPAAAVEAEERAEEEAIPEAPSEEKELPASDPMKCVNVMEKLVEEKAPRYIKMMEVCNCSRCQEDVKALCLTNLPAKYIVVHEDNMLMPMLTLYENKYASAITAQLVAACETVKKCPRHE